MHMKKFFISTGLAAISAAGIQSACADSLVSPKAWNVDGRLRGFYDDNYNISGDKKGSWGAEVSPSVSFNLPLQQTDLGIRYRLGAYYYNDRQELHLDAWDYSHQLELWLNHAFNERWKLTLSDSLAYGQEPELLRNDPLNPDATYRRNGDNFSNHARIALDTQWTPLFGTTLHYGNNYYNYQNHGATTGPAASPGPHGIFSIPGNPGYAAFTDPSGASLSGLLDRVEQDIGLDLNWTLSPATMFFVGYDLSLVNYTGNEPVGVFNYDYQTANNAQSYIFESSDRDGMSHSAHVGLNHELTSSLLLAMSVGVNYSANTKNPFEHSKNFSPIANASLSYTYAPGSFVQFGVSQGQNSTDVVQPGADGSLTQYQNTTVVYGNINHHITEKLTGSLIGRFAYATYEGGFYDSFADYSYSAGINFNYQFTRHFSADAGYNYDQLVSELSGRAFNRNRVYLGLAASY